MLKTIYKKFGMLWLVITLSIIEKFLEWTAQYFISGKILVNGFIHALSQLSFIFLISVGLYYLFIMFDVNKKTFLFIPPLAYAIKEIFNWFIVYSNIINNITVTSIFLEPLLLLGMIIILNKYYLKIK